MMMKRPDRILAFLLVAATIISYWPSYSGGFLWDDNRHITGNTFLRSFSGLWSIWFQIGATPQYYPLTHTSFWIEWQLWKDNPLGYHIVNVMLHTISSLLVVLFLKRIKLHGAWLAGFVFALHPVHVESVAWISERKNTLSVLFVLLTLITFPGLGQLPVLKRFKLDSAEDGAINYRAYGVAMLFFLMAVLSKTVTCTLPVVILAIVFWKKGKIVKRDGLLILPMFLVTIYFSRLTSWMEQAVVSARGPGWGMSFTERLLIAGKALWWYAGKVVWPGELAFSYERWVIDTHSILAWIYVVAAILLLLTAWLLRKRLGIGPFVVLFIFGATLFPALSFFNLFPHLYSFVADHFQYHSNIALIAGLCAGVSILTIGVSSKTRSASASVIVLLLGVLTFKQSQIYHDRETLWRDTVIKTPTSWLARNNLAVELMDNNPTTQRLREALEHLELVRVLCPGHDRADRSMGEIYLRLNDPAAANQAFLRAEAVHKKQIEDDPYSYDGNIRLGELYDFLGRNEDAARVYQKASDLMPTYIIYAQRAAERLVRLRQWEASIPYLQRWISLWPTDLYPYLVLANCHLNLGQKPQADAIIADAHRLEPNIQRLQAGLIEVARMLNKASTSQPASR